MSRTKLVLLGTGTPIMASNRYQSSLAIIVDEQPYIVDCGSGILERLSNARAMGIKGLDNQNLTRLFITHFHPDHTLGLAGFIIAPWNMQRWDTLKIYGPKGIKRKVNGLLKVYDDGIEEHLHNNPKVMHPLDVKAINIKEGVFYKDDLVTVEAITVVHGSFEAYSFKFITPDKTIVVSGDTCPVDILLEKAKGCDILVHEVYSETAMATRPKVAQDYFREVHTGGIELGEIAKEVQPKQLILTHQIAYGLSNGKAEATILEEIKKNYKGPVAYGNDLDVFE